MGKDKRDVRVRGRGDGKEILCALTEEEQQELKLLVSRGRAAAYKQTHARILLLRDENQADGATKDLEIASRYWLSMHRGPIPVA